MLESGLPIKKWQRKVLSYKNKHKGKKCILIGNGPSVSLDDLKIINDLDCITFVFNRFHKAYEQVDFNPDYTISIDPIFINDFFDELLLNHRGELFIGHHKEIESSFEYTWFKVKSNEQFNFSSSPVKYIEPGGNVVIAALQLAYFMGISEFYLYGIDHDFSFSVSNTADNKLVKGEGNHFIRDYRSNKAWCPPHFDMMENAFTKSKEFIELNDRKIFNISRFSKLNILPKLDFDCFIKQLG